MSYRGAKAQAEDTETRRAFAVSSVRLAADGHIAEVMWAEWNPKSNLAVGSEVLRSVAEVVEALHDGARVAARFSRPGRPLPERRFVVLAHADGRETIALDGPPSAEREIGDIAKIGAAPRARAVPGLPPPTSRRGAPARTRPGTAKPRIARPVFAVSKVRLDPDGRVTAVLWGRVDTQANAWATPEAMAPVDEVVRAIQAGNPVFALFPTTHGHVPERQFGVVAYDDGWQTIVLEGPTVPEREIHDMDRVAN